MAEFSIVSVGCDCEQFVKPWFNSIVRQTIQDFEVFIVIDPSKDRTAMRTVSMIKDDSRFHLIAAHEDKNYGALYNRCLCTKEVSDPESVIMHVDLDDAFFVKDVIEIVKKKYDRKGCWMTYGSYKSNVGGNWNREIPEKVWKKNSHRKNQWSTSALRTFKKWLWDKINQDDFVMPDGNWIKRGTDLAFMFPMLEMAGPKRVQFIRKFIYYYNVYGQQNKKQRKHEDKSVEYTRSLPSYPKIEA